MQSSTMFLLSIVACALLCGCSSKPAVSIPWGSQEVGLEFGRIRLGEVSVEPAQPAAGSRAVIHYHTWHAASARTTSLDPPNAVVSLSVSAGLLFYEGSNVPGTSAHLFRQLDSGQVEWKLPPQPGTYTLRIQAGNEVVVKKVTTGPMGSAP